MLHADKGIEVEVGGTILFMDKEAAIKLANNKVFYKRSKHIAIRFHFIKERVEEGHFCSDFVRTLGMAAYRKNKHWECKCWR